MHEGLSLNLVHSINPLYSSPPSRWSVKIYYTHLGKESVKLGNSKLLSEDITELMGGGNMKRMN